jgi:hypothetical protein
LLKYRRGNRFRTIFFNNFSPCHPTKHDNHYTRAGRAPNNDSLQSNPGITYR